MARSPFHPFHFEIDKNTQADLDEYTTERLNTLFNHDEINGLFKLNSENDRVFNKEKWNETLDTFHSWRDKYVKREAEIEEAINKGETPAVSEDDSANYKYMYPDDLASFLSHYDQEQAANILNSYQEIVNKAPELKDKFSTLFGMYEHIERSKDYQRDGDKNQLNFAIKKGNDGSHLALLTMKNFGGLGLNFTIENGRSILFDDNKPLTQAQVAEFARFFKDQGFHISDFKGLEDVKVVDDHDANKEIGSFEELYLAQANADLDNMSSAELSKLAEQQPNNPNVQEALQQKLAHDEANGGDETGSMANIEPDESQHQESGPFADYINTDFNSKTPNFTMRGFKNAIYDRAGMMRVEKRCITTRRLADGSLAICFYGSENDLRKDGTMDKEGVVRHTKKCMFVAHPGKPPKVGLYIPQGAKMETGYAKAIIGALKKQGYPYIKFPSAKEVGTDVFKALLEACGDQLAIPVGVNLDAAQLEVLLSAAQGSGKDPQKADDKDLLLWKMALVERLDEQLASKDNSEVKNFRDKLEGDIRFTYFSKMVPSLESYINSGISGEFGEKWNDLELAAAKKALGKVIEAVKSGQPVKYSGPDIDPATGKPQEHIFKFDYLNKDENANNAQVMQFFEATIQKEYPGVVEHFTEQVNNGAVDASDNSNPDNSDPDNSDLENSDLENSEPENNNSKNKITSTTISAALNIIRKDGENGLNIGTKAAAAYGSEKGQFKIKLNSATGLNPTMAEVKDGKYNPSKFKNRKVPLRSDPYKPNMGGRSSGGRE